MVKVNGALIGVKTIAELAEHLGGISVARIRFDPLPGIATEEDILATENEPRKGLCELIDGVLVEKAMGAEASQLAGLIMGFLFVYLKRRRLGIYLGEAGQLRLWPGRVRVPDVCFISWDRLGARKLPPKQIPDIAPDLAIEVLSRGNTKKEMLLKRRDYFQSGVREVWEIQPKNQTAEVYTAPTKHSHVGKDGTLEGGEILPEFHLPLKELFDLLEGVE